MPLQENTTMDKPSMDRLTHRLYPSLPNVDSYDRCVGEKLPAAAELRPERLQENKQSDTCGADGDHRLKAQMLILVEQRKELISINDKWAKEYQTMVRFYREKVRQLKASLQQNHSHVEEGLCEEGEKHITLCKKPKLKTPDNKDDKQTCDDADVNSELMKVEKEAWELRGQNSTLTRRGQHQSEEIKRLNKALEEAFLTSPPLVGSSETLQDLWKHQAEVYREDFLTERKDREKLKEKYLELENRFKNVRSELRVLKSQATWTPTPHPVLERVGSNRVKLPNQPLNQQYLQVQRGQLS
ncbi:TNFAIP3-interacting protein 1-like isoform X1 [Hippoglossus hippoglossus]|uniref:TNFAIP3-interacting protein 1-like isoform X1 n=1 Tax=Hippoglossus hippoglossus TaxID=8267 RepID=UPI00148E3718|nr:TNFAIP3-interacting protein 1-like isoform X1 [Hippoglossus hippoglossus]